MIVAAVDGELKALRGRLRRLISHKVKRAKVWQAEWGGTSFCLVRTGIGPRKARAAVAPLLAKGKFQGLISIGYAGGLRDGCRVGDILLPDEILSIPPLPETRYHPDRTLLDRARRRAQESRWSFHTGRMLTTHHVVCAAEEKRLLGNRYGAESVEMESGILAELAAEASLPFLVVRVISDEAAFSLPESLALLDHVRKRKIRSIARCVLTQPVQTFRFLRLMQNTRRASESLARFLVEEILEELGENRQTQGKGAG